MTQAIAPAALDIVMSFHRAWTTSHIDEAMALLSDDFICHTPGDGSLGKEAYREYLASFVPDMTGLVDLAQFVERDRVALFYYPQTAHTAQTLAAEYFVVREGSIAESHLAFDRLSYVPPAEAS